MKIFIKILKGLFAQSVLFFTQHLKAQQQNTTLLGRWAEGPCYTIDVSGKIACYGNGGYLEVTDISNPLNPVELSKVVLPSFVSDVKISGNYVYVADEWGGFRVVDISDPANAVEAGFLSLVGSSNRLSVTGNYAYITSEHYGLYILDIADPANPVVTGSIKLVDVFGFIYDVTANTNYVYVYLAGKGIDIIEVSEPSGPNEAGFLEGSGYYGNFDLALDGNYLFWAGAPDGLQIVDVSDPKIPVVVADITGDFDKVSVKDNYLYAGSGRFIYVFNISDKSNPIQVGSFKAGGNTRDIDVAGNVFYVADASAGLYIVKNDLLSAVEPALPENGYDLLQNHPNPFKESTTFDYTISRPEFVTLKIYAATGKLITTIVNRRQAPGNYSVHWNARNIKPGIYSFCLTAGNYHITKQCVVLD